MQGVGENPVELVGQTRIALNQSTSSIHDPEQARKLGFRGSAVGGNVHLDLFAPLLVEAYGPAWFEQGALSLYFNNIVVSGEPVQAVVDRPAGSGPTSRSVRNRRGTGRRGRPRRRPHPSQPRRRRCD